MTILEYTMKQIIETDKEIIERLSNEVLELKELLKVKDSIIEQQAKEITELKTQVSDLKSQLQDAQSQIKTLTKCIGTIEDTPQYIQLELNYNKVLQEIDILKNNNKIEDSEIFINMKKEKDKYKMDFEKINLKVQELEKKIHNEDTSSDDNFSIKSKIRKALDSQKIIFEKEFNLYKEEQENKYNSLYNEFSDLKNNVGIPTPSNSDDIKIKKKKTKNVSEFYKVLNNNKIINLNDNLYEIVYYRYINNEKYLPGYHTTNGIPYLECCGKKWDYKELDNQGVTCLRCFKTYLLNDEKKLKKHILPEHIISDEKEILSKIRCNNKKCDFIYKKEIDLCINCKNIENCEIFEYPLPDVNDEYYKTKISLAAACHNSIMYTAKIYDNAREEGLVKNGWKPLVDYVKTNNLMKEKQTNIIKNKIIRCGEIRFLYNSDKYVNIQDYIKRLEFDLNSLSKLKEDDYYSFKYDLEEKLNIYLKKYNKNNNKEDIKNDSFINKNHEYCCKKCLIEITKEQFNICDKCKHLCIIEECNKNRNKIGNIVFETCINHTIIPES